MTPFPEEIARVGPLVVTDTVLTTAIVSVGLVVGLRLAMARRRSRRALEIVYEFLEHQGTELSHADVRALVPLILTLWIFIGLANLLGIVPGLASPTRDLSLSSALALIAFFAGHIHAWRTRGAAYLRTYIEPNPLLLPFNVIGEVSRTVAMSLRLFGNMLSGTLIGAIIVMLVGLLLPVPLMLLSVLTGVVQAYIFGVLTLVFAASSLSTAHRPRKEAST